MSKVLFIRCRESVDPNIFRLVEEQIRNLTYDDVICETIDITPLNYKLSFFKKIFDKEKVYYAEEIIRKKRPDIIVLGNDVAISATIIKVCNLIGIPSLVIQHGILTVKENKDILDILKWRKYVLWRIFSSVANIQAVRRLTLYIGWRTRVLEWGAGGATKYAVMGSFFKHLLISHGVPAHKIVVTGYPIFDLAPRYASAFDKQATFKKLGLDQRAPLILYTTQPFVEDGIWSPSYRRLLVESVIDAVNELGDAQLFIKVHPREAMDEYERLLKLARCKVSISKDFDLNELLLASDVLLTVSSTTGIWGLVYGKPLIAVTCFPVPNRCLLEKAAIQVGRLSDLSDVIRHLLKEKRLGLRLPSQAETFLREHIHGLKGQSARRIAELIIELLENQTELAADSLISFSEGKIVGRVRQLGVN